MIVRTTLAAALALAGAAALPAAATAHGWAGHYPGRAQVNARIVHQQRLITQERREGDLTAPEARALRGDLHDVRLQERTYARANDAGGHLTRAQVRDLNRQLGASRRAIGR